MTAPQLKPSKSFIKFLIGTRAKMAGTSVSLFIRIRDVSLPSSNIPLVVSLTKTTLIVDQFPFRIHEGSFVHTNANKFRRLLAFSVILLHLAVVVKWVLDQWLNHVDEPIWKFVLMYYYVTLACAVIGFTAHLTWLKSETVSLLNSAIQVERDSRGKGEFCKLKTIFVVKKICFKPS